MPTVFKERDMSFTLHRCDSPTYGRRLAEHDNPLDAGTVGEIVPWRLGDGRAKESNAGDRIQPDVDPRGYDYQRVRGDDGLNVQRNGTRLTTIALTCLAAGRHLPVMLG